MVDLQFWGKAQPAASGPDVVTAHPLAYHSLDVAACAREILEVRPSARRAGARLLGLCEDDASNVLVGLIALHDLGKCAPKFQIKSPEHWPAALGGRDPTHARPGHHTRDGYVLWEHLLSDAARKRLWPRGRNALDGLAPAIFGHHGRPTDNRYGDSAQSALGRAGCAQAMALASALLDLLHDSPVDAPDLSIECAALASWWVAGLTTLADWIGSNPEWFAYVAPLPNDPTLCSYWQRARSSAAAAVRAAGLVAPRSAPLRPFAKITGKASPTPLQRWAEVVPLPDGPLLTIIEDVTGAGKTEAAQMLVHRLLSAERASGAYWAMPTQATANAMYARQSTMFDALYNATSDSRPSLVLAHGQQRLHAAFRTTVLGVTGGVTATPGDAHDEEPTQHGVVRRLSGR